MKIENTQTVFFWMALIVSDFGQFDFFSDFISRYCGESQEDGALMRNYVGCSCRTLHNQLGSF